MRSRIVAMVMMKGHAKLAVDILSTEAPAFSLPEKMVLAAASDCPINGSMRETKS